MQVEETFIWGKKRKKNRRISPLDGHAIKNESETIQCKKLRNCDVKEYKDIRHLSKF